MQIWLQKIFPQYAISRLLGLLANCKCKRLKNWGIKLFIKHYHVDLSEAVITDYRQYPTFNDFFIRHLKPDTRPYPQKVNELMCPIDGIISQLGKINGNEILQAKGIYYTLENLLASQEQAQQFQNGNFLTLYLAPKDYHRYHMPFSGKLLSMHYIPGRLFSVNPYTVCGLKGLFTRNERVICYFKTEFGPMAIIAIGAMIVGSITMNWHGTVTPPRKNEIQSWDYSNQNRVLERGDEIGYFTLGSSVIVLLPEKIKLDEKWVERCKVKVGEVIGSYFIK